MALKVADLLAELRIDASKLDTQLKATVDKAAQTVDKGLGDGTKKAAESAVKQVKAAESDFAKAGRSAGEAMADGIERETGRLEPVDPTDIADKADFGNEGERAGEALADGIDAGVRSVAATVDPSMVSGSRSEWGAEGKQLGDAFADGIESGVSGVSTKIDPSDVAGGRSEWRSTGDQLGGALADGVEDGFDDVDRSLKSVLDGLPLGLGGVAAGAGAVLGAGLMSGLVESMSREQTANIIGARLSTLGGDAEMVGAVAGGLYAKGFGESFADVGEAIDAVFSTIPESRSTVKALEDITATAMYTSQVLGTDLGETVKGVGVLLETGLARDAQHAFDIITAGAESVDAAMRGEFLAVLTEGEYVAAFQALGYSAEEMLGVLVEAADQGSFIFDKVGDSVKEFAVLNGEMTDAVREGYALIGEDADTMHAKLLEGGDTAKATFEQIIAAILAVEDPSARAQAAIALLGTPITDVAYNAEQLSSTLNTLASEALPNVSDAAAKNATAVDGAATSWARLKRNIEGALAIGGEAISEVLLGPQPTKDGGTGWTRWLFGSDDPKDSAIFAAPWTQPKGKRAAGGPVDAGTWLVGEEGPELLTLGAGVSGHVFDALDTRGLLSLGAMPPLHLPEASIPIPALSSANSSAPASADITRLTAQVAELASKLGRPNVTIPTEIRTTAGPRETLAEISVAAEAGLITAGGV